VNGATSSDWRAEKMPSLSRWFIISAVGTLFIMGVADVRAEGLTIFAGGNPPLSFEQNGKATGLVIEIVNEIQRRLKTDDRVDVVPWARGYRNALMGPNVVLVPTVRTEERESLFQWVGPLLSIKTSFYARKESSLKISNLDDAKKIPNIGATLSSYTTTFLQSNGFHSIYHASSTKNLVKKLLARRNNVIAISDIELVFLMKGENIKREDISLLYTFMRADDYIAFSKDTPDYLVAKWQDTLNGMKNDGSFAKIYARWLPEAPPTEIGAPVDSRTPG
jgi:polar amino acid transport system substrate-binding protein